MGKTGLLAGTAALGLVLAALTPAFAQEPGAPPLQPGDEDVQPAPAGQAGGIPEITVTARKVEETLSDAPVAVSAVTQQQIKNLGLQSIDDFARQATGISFSQAFGRSTDRPVIRGQSNVLAGVQAGVETGAAYFIDGIYYQGDIQGFDPEAIERVEIIKGPQSALYGRNTYAGAINYVTRGPTETLTASGRASAAEYDEYTVSATIAGPILGERLGFRVGGRYYTYGGQYENQLTGEKVGDEETASGYAILTALPIDDLRIRLRGQYQKDDDGPLAIFLQGAAQNNCLPGFRSLRYRAQSPFLPGVPAILGRSNNANQYFCGVVEPQPDNVRLNTDPVQTPFGVRDGTAFDGVESETWLGSAIIDYDVGGSGWVISSLTGYRDYTNLFGTDSDHSEAFFFFGPVPPPPAEPAFANTNRDDVWDISQEVRITSPTNLPVRGMLGGYYFYQNFDSVDLTFDNPRGGEPLGSIGSQRATIEDFAVFGLLEWDITDAFSVTGELRYAEEYKTLIDRAFGSSFCAGAEEDADLFSFTDECRGRGRFESTDPRITVNYTTPGGALIYAVYATGQKPGGFNGTVGVTAGFPTYEQERVKGGELGLKFDALDNRLRVSVSGYYNELSKIQLTSSIPDANNPRALNSIVTNTGDGENFGLEIEATAAPSDYLTLTAGFSYIDARFTSGCDSDQFIFNSGGIRVNFDTTNPPAAALPLCDISGNRLPLYSPHTVFGSATYELPLRDQDSLAFWSNVNFSYEDSKYVQVHNRARTGDTFLVNARLGIRTERFSVAVFGRNLTDEDTIPLATRWFDYRYGAGTRDLPPAASVTFNGQPAVIETGAPRGFFATLRKGRTFGVEATFSF